MMPVQLLILKNIDTFELECKKNIKYCNIKLFMEAI